VARRVLFPIAVAALLAPAAAAQIAPKQDPVQWSLELSAQKVPPGGRVLGRLKATIEPGWHLYSPTTPPGGPQPTRIALEANEALSASRLYQPKPTRKFDPNFQIGSETFDNEVVFLIEIEIAAAAGPGTILLETRQRYQACTDKICLRLVTKRTTGKLLVNRGAVSPVAAIPTGYLEVKAPPRRETTASPAPSSRFGGGSQSLGRFLLVAFGFGLASIVTPCVFPMIPITVSFFLGQRQASRRQVLFQAGLFCLGIVVLFSGLGLLLTAALGPFAVVQLSANPWVNGFIALMFLAFGLSLLGAFEITLPSRLLTGLDQASRRGGILGTLLMGLTFSLTSFACVGPIVGTLLAASVQGEWLEPVLGMASFSTGLALPFFLLALFPGFLQRLPRSGGWMSRVKVVLGFIVLAAMLKYLSNVDHVVGLDLLTRERFLAAWVILFAMPGLYLLGLLRLEGIRADETLGVGRALAGSLFLSFSLSLLPGMFGGPLGELDAYVPTPTSSGAGQATGKDGLVWLKDQYEEALAQAGRESKLVFVNFTGYACTNCRWMKTNMFPRPPIAAALRGFVLVELYTDGTDEASRGNQQLQESKFATVAIPHYVIIDSGRNVIASFVGLTRNTEEFLAFLKAGRAPAAAGAAGL